MKIAIALLVISWIWIIYEFKNAPLIKEDETPNN
jgi:hypothetical protein